MKYVTVPALKVTPLKPNGQEFTEKNAEGKDVSVGAYDMHRYLMMFIVNEVEIRTEPGQREPTAVPRIGVGYIGNKRTRKLDKAFERKDTGCCGGCVFTVGHGSECVVAVEDEDWKTVETIMEKKVWPAATTGAQFVDFEDAWMNKSEKKPEQPVDLKAV